MALPRKQILIVEDDRVLREACQAGLEQDGYGVTSVGDGEEALRHLAAGPPDLVLLDLLIPKIPGIEVLRALKADERTRAVPVIVLSNSSRDQDREWAGGLGAEAYLIKANLSLSDLRSYVRRLLEGA